MNVSGGEKGVLKFVWVTEGGREWWAKELYFRGVFVLAIVR